MVGDVVWTPFPFTNLSDFKPRPAVVVAKSGLDEWGDWIVCEVTSRRYRLPNSIEIAYEDMIEGQLALPGLVRPDRIATLNESEFESIVCRLTDSKMEEILAATRALF